MKKHSDATRIVNRQPRYCPTCGMSRPMMRFIQFSSLVEGWLIGLATIGLMLLLFSGIIWQWL